MKLLYLSIVTAVLNIRIASAQAVPSVPAGRFMIIHERKTPGIMPVAVTRRSDVLLAVVDTLPLPPVRPLPKAARIKPIPADTWVPTPAGEGPDDWWPGIHIGPGPPPTRPHVYAPYRGLRTPRQTN